MTFTQAWRKLITNVSPRSGTSKTLRNAFAHGAVWAMATMGVFALLAFAVSVASKVDVDPTLLLRAGAVLGASAGGAFTNISLSADVTGSVPLFVQAALHPTLATLIIVLVSFAFARRIMKKSKDDSRTTVAWVALSAGAGFAATLWLASLAASGSLSFMTYSFTTQPLGWVDIALTLLVAGGPAYLGAQLAVRNRAKATPTAYSWAIRAAITFALSYLAVTLVALAIYGIVTWIDPEFVHSIPSSTAPFSWRTALTAIAVGLLFLPTILINLAGVASGSTLGLTSDLTNSTFSTDALSLPFGLNVLPLEGGLSVSTTLGWPAQLGILGIVAIVGMTSAVIATTAEQFAPKSMVDFVRSSIVFAALAAAAVFFGSAQAAWSNHGAEANALNDTAVLLDAGRVTAGVSFVGAVFVATLAALAGFGATKHLGLLITSAYPRLIATASRTPRMPGSARKPLGRFIGLATIVVILAAIAYPTAVASVNRVWATIESPMALASATATKLTASQLTDVKTLLGGTESTKWLPDAVLTTALPVAGAPVTTSAKNESDEEWVVGNTDAIATVTWKTETGDIAWTIPTKSSLEDVWGGVKHLIFSPVLKPVSIAISTGQYYPADLMSKATLNGTAIETGTFAGVPGVYHLKSDGYKLIAANDTDLLTSGNDVKFVIGNDIALPSDGDGKLTAKFEEKQKSCATFDDNHNTPCFSALDIWDASESTSGTAPTTYFNSRDRDYKAGATTCSAGKDALTSAATMTRTYDCSTEVTFAADYTELIMEDYQAEVYSTGYTQTCSGYFYVYCYDVPYSYVSGYETRQREVEGGVIATVNYLSTVKSTIVVTGSLSGDNDFTVG
jgi:hypothetical protein